MDIRLELASHDDLGGDSVWTFEVRQGDRVRRVRAGVRISARGEVVNAAERYLHGDWTAAMLAYAAAAVRIAAPGENPVWVSRRNFAQVHRVMEEARGAHRPLFHSGSVEETLQFGSAYGERTPASRWTAARLPAPGSAPAAGGQPAPAARAPRGLPDRGGGTTTEPAARRLAG